MNTKSIFKSILTLSIFMFGVFSNAQSLVFTPSTTFPTNVPVGSTASFSLDYTSSVVCNISVALYKTDNGGVNPDYNNGFQTYAIINNLPATAVASTKLVNLPIPGGQTLSANLPAGVKYVWTYFLKDANDAYLAGTNTTPITIVASSTITDAISFSGTPPTSVAAGSSPTVGYQYTATTADRITKVGLDLFNADGSYNSDIVAYFLNPSTKSTTTTPSTQNPSLAIPSATTPSSGLPSGQYYKWEVAIYGAGYSYIGGSSTPVTVTASLGTSEVKNLKNGIYPNPAKDIVSFNKSSDVKKVQITDLSGRLIIDQSKDFTKGINISNLKKGTYIITINGSDSQKLIKN